jgi:hypothetical protein
MSFPTLDLYSNVSKEQMWDNFCKHKPNIIHEKFFIDSYTRAKTGFNPMPPKFSGKFCLIDSSKVDYFIIDGITDFYTETQRMQARKFYRTQTPMELWNSMKVQLNGLDPVAIKALRDKIFKQKYEATLFRPSWAKGVYELLTSELKTRPMFKDLTSNQTNVLDISSGWGDRLLAAISLGLSYKGFDPNTALKLGHDGIIKDFGNADLHSIQYEPFETSVLDKRYHIVFSSPPFFKLEEYSQDPNQSVVQYPELKDWIANFLIKSLQNAWDALLPGGIMAIHLCDYYEGKKEYHLVQPVLNQVIQFDGASWLGVIGLRGESERTWSIWCWTKD